MPAGTEVRSECGLQESILAASFTNWRNLFAFLVGQGFEVALLNPLRTRRFAEEELERTKTDSVDALGIARFSRRCE